MSHHVSFLTKESEIIALASAIKGASNPDEAIEKARAAGFSDEKIEQHMEAAMHREFLRRKTFLNLARAV